MSEEVAVEQSAVLSESEVAAVVAGEEPEAAVELPSDKTEFEVPEKFQGKSIEDVIKSYQELEKFKGTKEEGGDDKSQEEKVEESTEESPEAKEYQRYADAFDKNGGLSDAEYDELAAKGYNKATVDAEIKNRSEQQEFQKYKEEKQLNEVLEPLGGGQERFKEVAMWANKTKSEAEVGEFNQALAAGTPMVQQALLKSLYGEYEAAGNQMDTVLHTNSPQTQATKGYTTQEAFFKDVGSPEYQNNPKFREAVEKKIALNPDIF